MMNECWTPTPECGISSTNHGYGMKWMDGKVRAVHREVFFAYNGYFPEQVLHSCDNPPCYNPRHLRGGTAAENMADMKKKGRANGPSGERNHQSVLTVSEVQLIRRLSGEGKNNRELASRFGVCERTIWSIVTRRTWKHVSSA